jgi:uncharacterized protein
MRWLFRLIALLLLCGWGAGSLAAQAPIPPAPTQWVTDTASFLSPAAAQRLNARLSAYEKATGRQVLVWIGENPGGSPDEFAVKAFQAWKVGRQGKDDGAVLFLFPKDKKLRIEVGYGLEGQLPDALASRIIREVIVPRLQAGDPDGAISAGTGAILKTLGGEVDGPRKGNRASRPASLGTYVVGGIMLLGFLVLFMINPSLAMGLLFGLLSGGRRGGGGRDGWSGGGGRSGGGGASGSW